MKIISYNVNGIRAALKKGLLDWIKLADPDVICFQEIKANPDQFDEAIFEEAGLQHRYWFPAEKKGYSGTAVLCKKKPTHIEYGTGIDYMDAEGRNLRVDFEDFSVMSMYLPSGTSDARLAFKFNYMDDFLAYANELTQEIPNLIICGDYNICHQARDIHDPVRLKHVSGFLPREREWLSEFIASGFIDSFRQFDERDEQYSWWSYRGNSRERNKGWRLDYAMVTTPLQDRLKRAVILEEAKHSDHCPIVVEIT